MKKLILLGLFSFILITIQGQVLMQDAEGHSSIVSPGGTVTIDISEGLIKTNYYSGPNDNKRGIMWGVDLQGKNSSGVASLFSSGDFSPNIEMSGLFGVYFSKINYGKFSKKVTQLENNKRSIEQRRPDIIDNLESNVKPIFQKYLDEIQKIKPANKTYTRLKSLSDSYTYYKVSEVQKIIEDVATDNPKINASTADQVKVILTNLINDIQSNRFTKEFNIVDSEIDLINKKLKSFKNDSVNYSLKAKPYVRFGLNTNNFTHDNGIDSLTLESRFSEVLDTKGFIELGLTLRLNNVFYGIALGYSGVSNFSALSKKTYKLVTVDTTLSDGDLESTKEITAYKGEFAELSKYYLNIDVIYLKSLGKSSKNYIGFGGYLRSNFYSDTDILKDYTSLGLNISFINGKEGRFLGGFYVQSNDIFSQNQKIFSKTISFGLTVKFAFKTLSFY